MCADVSWRRGGCCQQSLEWALVLKDKTLVWEICIMHSLLFLFNVYGYSYDKVVFFSYLRCPHHCKTSFEWGRRGSLPLLQKPWKETLLLCVMRVCFYVVSYKRLPALLDPCHEMKITWIAPHLGSMYCSYHFCRCIDSCKLKLWWLLSVSVDCLLSFTPG